MTKPRSADRGRIVAAVNPQQPQVGHALLHVLIPTLVEVGRLAVHVWWFFLLVGAVYAAKRVRLLVAERRLARSGIDEIDRMDGVTFERRLVHVFRSRGHRVTQTQACGDYGADLVLEKDGVRTVVQAKRWKKNVGVKAIQEAVAAKPVYGSTHSLVVTNRYFTDQAKRLAEANGVELWDRDKLVRALLESAEVGTTAVPMAS